MPATLLATAAPTFNPANSQSCKTLTQNLLMRARSAHKGTDEKANEGMLIRVTPAATGKEPARITANGKHTTLRQTLLSAPPGSTVLLGKGTYELPASQQAGGYTGLVIKHNHIALIGDTDNPADVVIDTGYQNLGKTAGALSISGSDVSIANITLKRSIFHLIHLWKGADRTLVHNVHLIDGGQQFIKSSPGQGENNGSTVRCSQFLMTDSGRDNVWGYGEPTGWTTCYTGGIDTHNSYNWTISSNRFEGIYCDQTGIPRPAHGRKAALRNNQTYQGGLSEHAVHMWHSKKQSEHTITNNQIINCARGIGIGLKAPVYGGLIANNMIVSHFAGSREHDVGIALYHASDAKIIHNSLFFSHAGAYPNGIEIIHSSDKSNLVMNNLTNKMIRVRDGGRAKITANTYTAVLEWFADSAQGDLHVRSCARPPIPITSGEKHPAVPVDIDGEPREDIITIGADQC
jgi:hypothetical protein